MTDFLTALRSYLLGQKDVIDLCGRAVFVLAVPQEELTRAAPVGSTFGTDNAHKIVVLLSSGGEMRGATASRTIMAPKVDVVCYGETDFEAAKLERAVAEALKLLNREVYDGVLLHNITLASGPMQARDPVTFWPAMRRQAIVRADERSFVNATV